jgi:hypothetical protein
VAAVHGGCCCWCGCGKSFDCAWEWKVGEPSALAIASEPETRDITNAILGTEVTRLLESSIQ